MVRDMDEVRGTVLPPLLHAPCNAMQVVVQLESGQRVVVAVDAFVQQRHDRYTACLGV
jgi:hypothetical protein